MRKYSFYLLFIAIAIAFISCKKTEEFTSAPLSDYAPLEVGKYITYQLDSIAYLPFGTSSVTRSYEVKYHTEAEITDAEGRPAFRIRRYIRSIPSDPWTPDAAFMATNTGNHFEFVDNNLRYIKLSLPVRNEFSWKGNTYIDTYSLNSELKYLDGWVYTYDSVGVESTVGSFTLANTIKVHQRDEIIGAPEDPASYSEINIGVEKYAAGIGMVYRRFFHSEWQPGGTGFFADGSYGVTYTMIDHN
jgi:hypothetical protein